MFASKRIVRAIAVALSLALAACSSSSVSLLRPAAPSPAQPATNLAKATLRIVIPALATRSASSIAKHRAYISPATESLVGTLTPQGPGSAVTVAANLSISNNPNCQGALTASQTCSITFGIAPGNYKASFATYDQPLASGTNMSNGNVLSENTGFQVKIVADANNLIPVTFDGVPAQIAVFPSATSSITGNQLDGYTAPNCIGLEKESMTVIALDADGNYIVGPGAPTTMLASTRDASLLVGTPSKLSPNVYPLEGMKTLGQFPASGSIAGLRATVMTPQSNGTTGGITPGVSLNTTVNVTFVADCSVVTSTGDTMATGNDPTSGATAVPGLGTGLGTGTGAAATGDLRYVMLNAPAGNLIVFSLGSTCTTSAPCTVQLQGPLPPIVQNQTIDGAADTVIDGGGAAASGAPGYPGFRVFFVEKGSVVLRGLTIANARAVGGNGGSGNESSGGGGLGAGAGLFVDSATAAVTVVGTVFENSSTLGGTGGGGGLPAALNGGGGGLGGSDPGSVEDSGDGGGGVLGPAVNAQGGFGGGGGGEVAGAGGAAYAGEAAGTAASGSAGGSGGFGGGGGGAIGQGGQGGFGGGGGGAFGTGGSGGFGGGGGTSALPGSGSGGFDGGAAGSNSGTGTGPGAGGGAALGPAIFVNLGSVTIVQSFTTGTTSATAGPGGAGNAAGSPGTADATPVFDNAGTVNGVTVSSPGPVPGALPAAAP